MLTTFVVSPLKASDWPKYITMKPSPRVIMPAAILAGVERAYLDSSSLNHKTEKIGARSIMARGLID
ncbi:MAG TPA: hypothetical protein PKL57_12070 [Candidatus Wallbacteria bacterium]|nr:hypothetical protein [Candidatus Wallbacteria bacterium]